MSTNPSIRQPTTIRITSRMFLMKTITTMKMAMVTTDIIITYPLLPALRCWH